MSPAPNLILWLPRAVAIAAALFIGIFALDAFSEGRSFWASLPQFAVHLLPTWILLATIAVAWRRPWIGGVVFLSLAAVYAVSASRHPDWILVIAGPLALVGALYFLSWWWPRFTPPAS